MEKVKRWSETDQWQDNGPPELCGHMEPDTKGVWVTYEDYQALETKHQQYYQQAEQLRDELEKKLTEAETALSWANEKVCY